MRDAFSASSGAIAAASDQASTLSKRIAHAATQSLVHPGQENVARDPSACHANPWSLDKRAGRPDREADAGVHPIVVDAVV